MSKEKDDLIRSLVKEVSKSYNSYCLLKRSYRIEAMSSLCYGMAIMLDVTGDHPQEATDLYNLAAACVEKCCEIDGRRAIRGYEVLYEAESL